MPASGSETSGSENRPSSSLDELLDLVNLVSQCSSGTAPPVPALSVPTADAPPEILAPVDEPALFGSSHVMMTSASGQEASPSEPTAKMPVSTDASHPLSTTAIELSPPSEAPQPASPAQPAARPRRVPSLDELAEARDCILVMAGDRCWAVPLQAVVCLKPWPASPADIDVDLAEELGNPRLRPRNSRRWMLETTALTFGVDGLRGPGTLAWTLAEEDGSPTWMLAQADHCGETIGLIDLERWHRVEVIPDEAEAAAPEPASDPSPAGPPTLEWSPG